MNLNKSYISLSHKETYRTVMIEHEPELSPKKRPNDGNLQSYGLTE